jgi:hypothetical protein
VVTHVDYIINAHKYPIAPSIIPNKCPFCTKRIYQSNLHDSDAVVKRKKDMPCSRKWSSSEALLVYAGLIASSGRNGDCLTFGQRKDPTMWIVGLSS